MGRSRGVRPRLETRSPALRDALAVAARVGADGRDGAPLGETGTGKGVIARHVHALSPRRSRPFVTVNCAVISPTLVENELFGHARGAFTGADTTRVGHVEAAGNGTLFLDEVGDLPRDAQGKLLRLLEEHEYVRVGDTEPRRVGRAGRSPPRTAISAPPSPPARSGRTSSTGSTSSPSACPPLRERREDIPDLARAVVADSRRHAPPRAARDRPRRRGRARRLRVARQRARALQRPRARGHPRLRPLDHGRPAPGGAPERGPRGPGGRRRGTTRSRPPSGATSRPCSRATATLDAAAKVLGIDPSTLYRKRERYGLP